MALAIAVLVAGTLVAGCGSHTEAAPSSSPSATATVASPGPSTPVAKATSSTAPSSAPETGAPNSGKVDWDAVARASAERAAKAPSGDPVRPGASRSGADDKNFQQRAVIKGDVTVYTPVRTGTGLTVPVEIKNSGSRRALYQVDVRVQGPGGFDATVHINTDVVGVYPGGSWPVEPTASAPGKPLPEHPQITIERIVRREIRG
ncbi:hypothetical protein [Streptomyces noursei]|uniref:hypothetical protein n=1 Tax=Streptomyces noursei TaxID=1971 RepID=UPI0030F10E70